MPNISTNKLSINQREMSDILAEEAKDMISLKHQVGLEKMLLLNLYKEEYGHLLVKRTYSIPSYSPWPEWSHGFKLGSEVGKIRTFYRKGLLSSETIDQLNEMGFVWDCNAHKYQATIMAIKLYAKITKKDISKIPYSYTVPFRHKKWPQEFWGMRLGQVIKNVRNRPTSRMAQTLRPLLDEYAFDFSKQKGNFELIKESLLVYKALHGDLQVPDHYVIPSAPAPAPALSPTLSGTEPTNPSTAPDSTTTSLTYPKGMWGKNLGQIVAQMKYRRDYAAHREALAQLGFHFTSQKHLSFHLITRALDWYANTLHLPVNEMKSSYCVPRAPEPVNGTTTSDTTTGGSVTWPADQDLWGLRLGKLLWDIRHRRTYKDYEQHWSSLGVTFIEQDPFPSPPSE